MNQKKVSAPTYARSMLASNKQVISSNKIMHELLRQPTNVLGHVLSFLRPEECQALISTQKFGLFKSIPNDEGIIAHMSHELCRLVAMEGEDNQNKAVAWLRASPGLASRIIATKMLIQDAPGRSFKTPISAYGYAYWARDIQMCLMLQNYMCESVKEEVSLECYQIKTEGVSFFLQGSLIEKSTHWSMRPLRNAYNNYFKLATQLGESRERRVAEWYKVYQRWLQVGREQAKVPVHVAQLYFSLFENDKLKRSVKFYNHISKHEDFWFSSGRVHTELGRTFSIHRSDNVIHDQNCSLINVEYESLGIDQLVKFDTAMMDYWGVSLAWFEQQHCERLSGAPSNNYQGKSRSL